MFNLFKKNKKVTLVLGGGSARGLAHIGVLKVLEREKIPIDRIVGTSMGAFIGAAYAVGVSISMMEEKAYKFTTDKLLDPTIPRMGLLAGEKLELAIRDMIDSKTFADCKMPVAVVTTDVENGETIVHQTGDLVKIVRASCSWPGIFNPVTIDGMMLSDGGIKSSVPTRVARDLGAEFIIAVDVGFCVKKGKISNIFQMILQSFQITGEELNKYQSMDADITIKVNLGEFDQASFEQAQEAVAKGIESAEAKIEEIKEELGL